MALHNEEITGKVSFSNHLYYNLALLLIIFIINDLYY